MYIYMYIYIIQELINFRYHSVIIFDDNEWFSGYHWNCLYNKLGTRAFCKGIKDHLFAKKKFVVMGEHFSEIR